MKKAQIQLFETIGVLVVFFFLLIAGAVFYFKMQEISIQNDLAQQAHLRSLQATQRAMFLPELDCSFIGVQRENCFDELKLEAFSKVMQDPRALQTYFGLFGYASINVSESYPDKQFIGWMYNNPLDEYRSALKSLSPVLLYDPVANSYAFGVMEVTTYGAQ
jgi:hypothetical protein